VGEGLSRHHLDVFQEQGWGKDICEIPSKPSGAHIRILIPGAIYAISTKRQLGNLAIETAERMVSIAPRRMASLRNSSYGDVTDCISVDEESSTMAELTLDVPDELMQRL
jgi:hypothetical protein